MLEGEDRLNRNQEEKEAELECLLQRCIGRMGSPGKSGRICCEGSDPTGDCEGGSPGSAGKTKKYRGKVLSAGRNTGTDLKGTGHQPAGSV